MAPLWCLGAQGRGWFRLRGGSPHTPFPPFVPYPLPQHTATPAGPKEGGIALAWHPLRTCLLSITTTGRIYIWARHYAENWSAFAPDFKVGVPGDAQDAHEGLRT